MNFQKTLEYLQNCQYEQLAQEDLDKIAEIQNELENAQFDQNSKEDFETIEQALEICRRLLK